MSPSRLKHYASLIFGDRWQRGLSESLGCHRQTVNAWYNKNKRYHVPDDLGTSMKKLLTAHKNKIEKALDELK